MRIVGKIIGIKWIAIIYFWAKAIQIIHFSRQKLQQNCFWCSLRVGVEILVGTGQRELRVYRLSEENCCQPISRPRCSWAEAGIFGMHKLFVRWETTRLIKSTINCETEIYFFRFDNNWIIGSIIYCFFWAIGIIYFCRQLYCNTIINTLARRRDHRETDSAVYNDSVFEHSSPDVIALRKQVLTLSRLVNCRVWHRLFQIRLTAYFKFA